jgi:hypothetical protein
MTAPHRIIGTGKSADGQHVPSILHELSECFLHGFGLKAA